MVSDEQIEFALEALNTALEKDPDAIRSAMCTRHQCNSKLAEHPSIQCGLIGDDYYQFGMLGLINGVLGINPKNGWGPIGAEFDDNRIISKFVRMPLFDEK